MPREPSSVAWQFLENPCRRTWVDFAIPDGSTEDLAAIYAVLPVRVRIDRDVFTACQSVDTITDDKFRGRGLFLKLAESCYRRASSEGAAFVYGFPNRSSAHGFFSKLDWTNLDPVPFLIRPLRVKYLVQRLGLRRTANVLPDLKLPVLRPSLPAGARIAEWSQNDERITTLWRSFARGFRISIERDANYFAWRLAKPDAQYQRAGVFEGDRLSALGVTRVVDKHRGRIGYVVELMGQPNDEKASSSLLAELLRGMADDGADAALAWSLPHSPNYRTYLRAGFVPLPPKLRPIELHFGARAFDDKYGQIVRDRSSWYLSYCDSDTV